MSYKDLYLISKKLNKYKIKNKYNKKNIYSLKYNHYNNLLVQNGGKLIDGIMKFDSITSDRIKLLLVRYKNDIIELISTKKPTPNIQTDILGCGANGCVFLLTDDAIIKILFDINSFNKEIENNDVINNLSIISPFFPRFKCMKQHKINLYDIGIIVSEKLQPINVIFDFTNKHFVGIDVEKQFYHQIWFIYYLLYEFYLKINIVILHNDIKIDNFMLREINSPSNNYNYKGLKNIDIIPYIIIGKKKYVLTLIDFGEAFIFNSTDINSITQNKIFNNVVSLYKYDLTSDGNSIDEQKLKGIYFSLDNFIKNIAMVDIQSAIYYDAANKQIFSDPELKRILDDLTTKFN